MLIVAFIAFAVLIVAWMMAPAEKRATAPAVEPMSAAPALKPSEFAA